jgi:hypothetical protein
MEPMEQPPGSAHVRQASALSARSYWLIAIAAILAAVGVAVWASDRVTVDGERTVYTARCEDGAWEGLRCRGRLVPGDRYRYRASRSRNEVSFWVVGSSAPSGLYKDCSVSGRGNWRCNAETGQARSITLQMVDDRATHGPSGLTIPFHAVEKWKWWLLRLGWFPLTEAWY